MRFYTQSHRYYCGIDLHARWMYLCILDPQGEVLLHRNLRACPEAFLKAVEPTARTWSSPSNASTETAGSPGTQTWKSESPHHTGSQAGSGGLFHLKKRESL